MDFMTISGLAIGFAAVWYVLSTGGIIKLLFNLNAAILVFGGVLGATLITYPWYMIKRMPKCLILMFFPRRFIPASEVITVFETCSKRIRREGLTSNLIEDIPDDKFFKEGVNLLIDGHEEEFIRDTLGNEIKYFTKRHSQNAEIFKSMGAYAPIFGLLGTLIGVVQVLRNLTDPASMGQSMAIAITTTFYGIFSTNFLFLPVAGKLDAATEKESRVYMLIVEGVLSLKRSEIPSVIRKRLQSFLAESEQK